MLKLNIFILYYLFIYSEAKEVEKKKIRKKSKKIGRKCL